MKYSKHDILIGRDPQNSFEENAKEMRYCNAKLNFITDVLRDEECWLFKSFTNHSAANETLLINQTFRIDCI